MTIEEVTEMCWGDTVTVLNEYLYAAWVGWVEADHCDVELERSAEKFQEMCLKEFGEAIPRDDVLHAMQSIRESLVEEYLDDPNANHIDALTVGYEEACATIDWEGVVEDIQIYIEGGGDEPEAELRKHYSQRSEEHTSELQSRGH